MEFNTTPLESLTAALAYAMGVEPPKYAQPANEDLTAYIDRCLAGQKADRVFIYNSDAIGQWLVDKYPQYSEETRSRTELTLPMITVDPPMTPCAFGTMYTGAPTKVHGIEVYERKLITIDTLFDALARAGKKVALLSLTDYSMSIIFAGRDIDYYIYDTYAEINAKAAQLIVEDKYDFILTYNANFDDTLHKKGPEHPDTLGEMYFNFKTFCMFDQMIQNLWGKHNVLVGTGMDHGCHLREDGRGVHGANTPEDRNIVHFYKIYPKKTEE